MFRFYCPDLPAESNSLVELSSLREVHHIKSVLRLKKESQVRLFNGQGQEAVGTIVAIDLKSVQIRLDYFSLPPEVESTFITLACAIPKKAKFEWIIEKATELGVNQIIPMLTNRTIVNIPPQDLLKKKQRYETVAINAAKQSGCPVIPTIFPPQTFFETLSLIKPQTVCLIPALIEKRLKFKEALLKLKTNSSILILIGPEGDFTKEEYAQALAKGAIPVSLGTQILKVDTAAIVSLAVIKLLV